MLEYFGFDSNLERKQNISIKIDDDKVIELSNQGIDFLQRLYKKYSTHEILTPTGIDEVFSTVKEKPWEPDCYQEMVPSIDRGLSLHS